MRFAMKHLLCPILVLITATLNAQDCSWSLLPSNGFPQTEWGDGYLNDDGTLLIAASPSALLGDIRAIKMTADSLILWDKRIASADPSISLTPIEVIGTPDGGAMVLGQTEQAESYGSVIIKLSGAGTLDWARAYVLTEPALDHPVLPVALKTWNNGDYLLVLNAQTSTITCRLDITGLPLESQQIRMSEDWYALLQPTAVSIGEQGDVLIAGQTDGYPFAAHLDSAGDVEWCHAYSDLLQFAGGCGRLADGGYLIGYRASWPSGAHMLRVDSAGQGIWLVSTDNGYSTHSAFEYPNGDIYWNTTDLYTGGIRLDALGSLVSYQYTTGSVEAEMVGTHSGDLIMGSTCYDTLGSTIGLGRYSMDPGSSCQVDSTEVIVLSQPVPEVYDDSLLVDPAVVFTTPFLLGPMDGYDELDLAVYMANGPARPGFMFHLNGAIENLGGQTGDTLTSTLEYPPNLDVIEAQPAPSGSAPGFLTWSQSPAGPFGGAGFSVWLQIPVSTSIGTELSMTLATSQSDPEVSLVNNMTTLACTVTGSFDPNDKLVWPQEVYHIENDSILDYTIRFQNTGTDTAFNVVVVDTLPLDVDLTTIRFGATSHLYTYELTGNGLLTFTFANILLPDSNTNEPLSHGLVNFTIKPMLPLALGQEITNAADIYFDFNEPVRTPDATVVVTDETGVRPVAVPEKLNVFPVPVKQLLTAMLPARFVPVQAIAIGADGRRVPLFKPNVLEQKGEYDVRHLASGGYVLTLVDRNGKRMSARFTKE